NSGNNEWVWCPPGSGATSLNTSKCSYIGPNQFSKWQSDIGAFSTGGDAHILVVVSALLDPSYKPQSGSPVIAAGANLTSLGIANLDVDKADVLRNPTGPWDAGAYQFCTGNACTPTPPPPPPPPPPPGGGTLPIPTLSLP